MIELVRNSEGNRLVMRIEKQQKIRILGALRLSVPNLGCRAVHEHAEGAHPTAVFPILALHALAVRAKPDNVFVRMLGVGIMVIEHAAVEIRMLLPVLDHALRELQKRFSGGVQIPVIPRQFVVLTVTIVVALLGARELIAAADHRGTLREHERAPEIAHLPLAQLDDVRIVSGALHAESPRPVGFWSSASTSEV